MSTVAPPRRKKLEWVHITPEEIQNFREERKLSRSRLAAELGVSPASVLNWESGRVASIECQQRLAALIAERPQGVGRGTEPSDALATKPIPSQRHTLDAEGPKSLETITATVSLVSKYVELHGANLAPGEFIDLIRNVRKALCESEHA